MTSKKVQCFKNNYVSSSHRSANVKILACIQNENDVRIILGTKDYSLPLFWIKNRIVYEMSKSS